METGWNKLTHKVKNSESIFQNQLNTLMTALRWFRKPMMNIKNIRQNNRPSFPTLKRLIGSVTALNQSIQRIEREISQLGEGIQKTLFPRRMPLCGAGEKSEVNPIREGAYLWKKKNLRQTKHTHPGSTCLVTKADCCSQCWKLMMK